MDDINISIDEPAVSISEVSNDVVITDQYSTDYTLPIASPTTLGGVKIGANIDETIDGTISVSFASASKAGVVKVGDNLTIESDGTLNAQAGGSQYVLPQATNVTLGGVYVDTAMSRSSANPVQNKVINSQLSTISGNVQNLSTDLGNLSTTVQNLSTTVGSQATDISNNASAITALQTTTGSQGDSISDLNSNVASLQGRMTDAEGDIDDLEADMPNVKSGVTLLLTETHESYAYDDIDSNTWSAGSIDLCAYGMTGYINVNLTGSLSIVANSTETIFTLPNVLPAYTIYGVGLTDAGTFKLTITDGGVVSLTNGTPSSVNITELSANVSIIIASDNP